MNHKHISQVVAYGYSLVVVGTRFSQGILAGICVPEQASMFEELAEGHGDHRVPYAFEELLRNVIEIPAAYGATVDEAMTALEARIGSPDVHQIYWSLKSAYETAQLEPWGEKAAQEYYNRYQKSWT